MKSMDYGHKESDRLLKRLERRISREYGKAVKEVEEKLNAHFASFDTKVTQKLKDVADGKITEKEYQDWAFNQMMIGNRWIEMRDTLAEDFHNANKIAASMVNDHAKDVYALNHNYGTFEVETGARVNTSYTLYDRRTVERLLKDNPNMLPKPGKRTAKRIAEGKDVLWNKRQIQSVMTQGILQGESIPKIAKRLAETVGDRNMSSAIRNARTMTTGAENAGRIDSYKRAEDLGIEVKKTWVATLDDRTRESHRHLDGITINMDDLFENGLAYPGDPSGDPEEVYNCRCTLVAQITGYETGFDDMGLRNTDKMDGMSYEEWKQAR